MVKEELYINGENVELLGSLNPNLTFNIADIANPDKRKADFSKTITLPASKKINKIARINGHIVFFIFFIKSFRCQDFT